jgi:uncharacterized SAM-binding protein YcdF (DUF218 family)
MFIFKKIVEAFVLPPGCLVVALIGLAFYLRKRTRAGAVACAALAALTWIGSTNIFSDALIRPLEYAYETPVKPEGDVIVLLCGGARSLPAVFSPAENLSSSTLQRVIAAAQLYKKTRLPVIITGGAPFSARPEADAAAAYLAELGVPQAAIITEAAARDTRENAARVREICDSKGFKRVILLTSALHMPRSVFLFERAGFAAVQPFPVARATAPAARRYFRDYLPGAGAETSSALNELFGLAFYRVYYPLFVHRE